MIAVLALATLLGGSPGPCTKLDACSSALLRRGQEWKLAATQCSVLLSAEQSINAKLLETRPAQLPAVEPPSAGPMLLGLATGFAVGFLVGAVLKLRY